MFAFHEDWLTTFKSTTRLPAEVSSTAQSFKRAYKSTLVKTDISVMSIHNIFSRIRTRGQYPKFTNVVNSTGSDFTIIIAESNLSFLMHVRNFLRCFRIN